MRYWLMKSEPDEVSIDDLAAAPSQTLPWFGVRNYQARNFMRDQMKPGDRLFFYHSSCEVPGIYGLAEVVSEAHADDTQFDRKSPYYDAKSAKDAPRWVCVDVKFVARTPVVTLPMLRDDPALARMRVLARGNRLSITPVTPEEWKHIHRVFLKRAP